jgi:hypothetical protein
MANASKRFPTALKCAIPVGLMLLYLVSFGPACWWTARTAKGVRIVNFIYQPIMRVRQPLILRRGIYWYATLNAQHWTLIRNTRTNECAWVIQAWSVGLDWSGD